LLSPTLAGKALALDYLEEEQQRQMTIKAANISLYYELEGKPYIINMIDTPGHVDFSGRVTRSLRAIDGAVVVVDAVEGVMVQTETVTRQALEERVRPVLYINKMDRLIKELKLTPNQVQDTLARIITDFNRLIEIYAEPEYREKWKVSPAGGTVAIGSAKDRWGFTFPQAEKKGIKFSDILNAFVKEDIEWLRETVPLHEAIIEMMITQMPPPHTAQKYRIPKIWRGQLETEIGQAMLNCDENGPAVMIVTNINVDPSAGVVATGRLFSGKLETGMQVNLIGARTSQRIQQVAIYMGPRREIVDGIPSGNIPALLGLDAARAGETITTYLQPIEPFETMKYVSEPVVTIAVEPKNSRDLPRLVDFLNKLSIEDPTLVTTVRPETGEYLISGMGTLHLEIALTWIQKAGIEVVAGKPIVLYRETILKPGNVYEGKSPNRHNRIYIKAEPLAPEVVEAIRSGELYDELPRREIAKILREKYGWDAEEARNVWRIDSHGNILVDATKGAQYLQESKEMIISGFESVMEEGVLASERMRGIKAILVDVQLHEDPVHRGYAQIVPASRRTLLASILSAEPVLLEPIMKITAKGPSDEVGPITRVISQKRGKILNIEQKEYLTFIIGEIPASETFDLSEVMRSATSGRVFWGVEFSRWAPVPESLKNQVIAEIRKRKGLPPQIPTIDMFVER
jgi:elongation factor 2